MERIDVLGIIAFYADGFRHLGYPSSADELMEAHGRVAALLEADEAFNAAEHARLTHRGGGPAMDLSIKLAEASIHRKAVLGSIGGHVEPPVLEPKPKRRRKA